MQSLQWQNCCTDHSVRLVTTYELNAVLTVCIYWLSNYSHTFAGSLRVKYLCCELISFLLWTRYSTSVGAQNTLQSCISWWMLCLMYRHFALCCQLLVFFILAVIDVCVLLSVQLIPVHNLMRGFCLDEKVHCVRAQSLCIVLSLRWFSSVWIS